MSEYKVGDVVSFKRTCDTSISVGEIIETFNGDYRVSVKGVPYVVFADEILSLGSIPPSVTWATAVTVAARVTALESRVAELEANNQPATTDAVAEIPVEPLVGTVLIRTSGLGRMVTGSLSPVSRTIHGWLVPDKIVDGVGYSDVMTWAEFAKAKAGHTYRVISVANWAATHYKRGDGITFPVQ